MVERLREWFGHRPDGVAAVWLFGSVARNQAGADSDVDVAILLKNGQKDHRLDATLQWWQRLGDVITDCEVDVVLMNEAPADLVHRVLRDGVLAFEGDRSSRIDFEVRSRNEYFDLVPVLQQYRRFWGGEP